MDQQQNCNRLADVLREGVGVVEMVLYSCLRKRLSTEDSSRDSTEIALLAGAVTGEVFGSLNPEETFVQFRSRHHAEIEQLLLSLATTLPELCPHLTDALRVQVLWCANLARPSALSSPLLQSVRTRKKACGTDPLPLPQQEASSEAAGDSFSPGQFAHCTWCRNTLYCFYSVFFMSCRRRFSREQQPVFLRKSAEMREYMSPQR